MFRRRDRQIQLKTPAQVQRMRVAGLVVGRTLETLRAAAVPGVSTGELDEIAAGVIAAEGALPSFKGYHGYPATICASVNEQVVHGIPSRRQVLRDGDVISIDCGAIVDGWHGDAAITVGVGEIGEHLRRLIHVCEQALWRGMAAARLGGRLSDISAAVEAAIRASGDYGIVEDYVGHGIGTEMHQEPQVPNYGPAGRGPRLLPGLVLAVEPMVTLGSPDTVVLDDDWTVVTSDGKPAAHFEHTFTLTPDGPVVLTALDGGKAGFEALGVQPGTLAESPS